MLQYVACKLNKNKNGMALYIKITKMKLMIDICCNNMNERKKLMTIGRG